MHATRLGAGHRRERPDADTTDSRERGRGLMRALVVTAPDDFAVRDVERPRPGPFEVLCRVRAVAICGTDPHIVQGHFPGFWPKDWPLIPGHEWCGDVVEVGEDAEALGWEVGTRVAGTSHAPCGYCQPLHRGPLQHLRELRRRGPSRAVRPQRAGRVRRVRRALGHAACSRCPTRSSDEEAAMLDPAGDRAAHGHARRPPAGRHRGRGRARASWACSWRSAPARSAPGA